MFTIKLNTTVVVDRISIEINGAYPSGIMTVNSTLCPMNTIEKNPCNNFTIGCAMPPKMLNDIIKYCEDQAGILLERAPKQ